MATLLDQGLVARAMVGLVGLDLDVERGNGLVIVEALGLRGLVGSHLQVVEEDVLGLQTLRSLHTLLALVQQLVSVETDKKEAASREDFHLAMKKQGDENAVLKRICLFVENVLAKY